MRLFSLFCLSYKNHNNNLDYNFSNRSQNNSNKIDQSFNNNTFDSPRRRESNREAQNNSNSNSDITIETSSSKENDKLINSHKQNKGKYH